MMDFPASKKNHEVPENRRALDLPMAQQFLAKTPLLWTQPTHTAPYDIGLENRQDGYQGHILPLPTPKKLISDNSQSSTKPAAVPTFITSPNKTPTMNQRTNSRRSPSISNSSQSRTSDQESFSTSTRDIEQAPKNDVRLLTERALTESQNGPAGTVGPHMSE